MGMENENSNPQARQLLDLVASMDLSACVTQTLVEGNRVRFGLNAGRGYGLPTQTKALARRLKVRLENCGYTCRIDGVGYVEATLSK